MSENNGRPPEGPPSRGGESVPKRGLRDEVVVFHRAGVGNVAAVLPVIPEGAPYKVREGIARRRITTLTGKCPCGATLDLRDRVNAAVAESCTGNCARPTTGG